MLFGRAAVWQELWNFRGSNATISFSKERSFNWARELNPAQFSLLCGRLALFSSHSEKV
jgi:hypothetical protein